MVQFLSLRKKYLENNQILVNFRVVKNLFKHRNRGCIKELISTADGDWYHLTYNVFFIEIILFTRFGILLPFSTFGKAMSQIELVAAINGGDGFLIYMAQKPFFTDYMIRIMQYIKDFR